MKRTQIQTPQRSCSNLYRDLRDRRLLLPGGWCCWSP